MRNHILIFSFAVIISIILCSCSSAESNGNKNESSSVSSENTFTENSGEVTPSDKTNEKTALEDTVLVRYFRQRKELPYDEDIKGLIENIKNCTDKPKAELTDKIGSITVNYGDDEESKEVVRLYLGNDDNIYAKYNEAEDDSVACKLDMEKLGFEE